MYEKRLHALIALIAFSAVPIEPNTYLKEKYKVWLDQRVENRQVRVVDERIQKRAVANPLQSASDQLASVVYLTNAAMLGEMIVQKNTTFGQVGVTLMIMENMPKDRDWISLIDPSDIKIDQFGDLMDLIENGNAKPINTGVIDQIMNVANGFHYIDHALVTSRKINTIIANYGAAVSLNIDEYTEAVQFLDFWHDNIPVLKSLSSDTAPIDSIVKGMEVVKSLEYTDSKLIAKSFESCQVYDPSSDAETNTDLLYDCLGGLRDSFQNVTAIGFTQKDINESAILIRMYYYGLVKGLFTDGIVKTRDSLGEVGRKLTKVQRDIATLSNNLIKNQAIFSDMLNTTNLLTDLRPFDDFIKYFIPISDTVNKIHTNWVQRRNQKRRKQDRNPFGMYIGLPEGINSLNQLYEATQPSFKVPKDFLESKIDKRTMLMKEFTRQRRTLLETSNGLKSIPYISSIINIILNLDVLKITEESNAIRECLQNLLLFKNLSTETAALKDLDSRLNSFNSSNWATVPKPWSDPKFSLIAQNIEALNNVFPPLSRGTSFLIEVKNALQPLEPLKPVIKDNTPQELNQTFSNVKNIFLLFEEGIKAVEDLSNAAKIDPSNTVIPAPDDITIMKDAISNAKFVDWNHKSVLSTEQLLSGLKSAEESVKTIETQILPNSQSYLSFSSDLVELKKLKDGIPKKTSQSDIDALEPMLTQFQSLEPLNIPPALKDDKPSEHITKLMNKTKILDKMSKDLRKYRYLVRDVVSVDELKKGNTVSSVATLFDKIETVQVVRAVPTVNAANIFIEYDKYITGLKNLGRYVSNSSKKIQAANLTSEIENNKAQLGTAYGFLKRLDKIRVKSFEEFADGIRVLIDSLRIKLDCKATPSDPKCAAAAAKQKVEQSNESDEEENKSFNYLNLVFIIVVIVLFMGIIFVCYYFKLLSLLKKRSGKKEKLSRENDEPKKKPRPEPDMDEPKEEGKVEDISYFVELKSRMDRVRASNEKASVSKEKASVSKEKEKDDQPDLKVDEIQQKIEKPNEVIVAEMRNKNSGRVQRICIRKQNKLDDCCSLDGPRTEVSDDLREMILSPNVREINHFVREEWPDKIVPDEPASTLLLINETKKLISNGSVIGHCMGEIGRTMAFMTIAHVVEKMKNSVPENIFFDAINKMQAERKKAVQIVVQYVFIQLVCHFYNKRKHGLTGLMNKKGNPDFEIEYSSCRTELIKFSGKEADAMNTHGTRYY